MTKIILPRTNQTGTNEWSDVESNDVAIREVVNGQLDNENLSGSAGITRANLAKESKPFTWYTPKIISTEESRTNAAYGTMPTADEITGISLPENGMIGFVFRCHAKASANNGVMQVYLNSTQVKTFNNENSESFITETFRIWYFLPSLVQSSQGEGGADVTTGQASMVNGAAYLFAAPGTYNLSIRFKSATGTVTTKERRLYAWTLGY